MRKIEEEHDSEHNKTGRYVEIVPELLFLLRPSFKNGIVVAVEHGPVPCYRCVHSRSIKYNRNV